MLQDPHNPAVEKRYQEEAHTTYMMDVYLRGCRESGFYCFLLIHVAICCYMYLAVPKGEKRFCFLRVVIPRAWRRDSDCCHIVSNALRKQIGLNWSRVCGGVVFVSPHPDAICCFFFTLALAINPPPASRIHFMTSPAYETSRRLLVFDLPATKAVASYSLLAGSPSLFVV